MNPELVNFHLPTTDQFSVAVDTRRSVNVQVSAGTVGTAPIGWQSTSR
jgi:hypothetical protein